jgi:hypothetical protein
MKSNYLQSHYNGVNYWLENMSNVVKQRLKQTRRKTSPCTTQTMILVGQKAGGQTP